MKFPNHIILDISKKNNILNTRYWIYTFLNFSQESSQTFNYYNRFKFFHLKSQISKLNTSKIDLEYLLLLKTRSAVKHKKTNIARTNLLVSFYSYYKNLKINKNKIAFFFNQTFHLTVKTNFNINSLFSIIFIKKEKIYTKLKYSRTPQYDIVSGGVAAIFSGFLGFLICEKFGLELLDSGDFYFLFMYIVFLGFSFRLFVKVFSDNNFSWNCLSFKWFFIFYKNIIIYLIMKIKNQVNK
jgi:hypothetical protein